MEYLIALVLGLVGALLVVNKQKEKAQTDAKLAETKGQDKELAEQQADVKQAIQDMDAGIDKMKAEREARKQAEDNLTLKERADRIKKGLQ